MRLDTHRTGCMLLGRVVPCHRPTGKAPRDQSNRLASHTSGPHMDAEERLVKTAGLDRHLLHKAEDGRYRLRESTAGLLQMLLPA
jgi:hypothetical protein